MYMVMRHCMKRMAVLVTAVLTLVGRNDILVLHGRQLL